MGVFEVDQTEIISRVTELTRPLLSARQMDLVELTCRQAGPQLVLRFLVDTARGVRLDELRSLNRAIRAVLDDTTVAAALLRWTAPAD